MTQESILYKENKLLNLGMLIQAKIQRRACTNFKVLREKACSTNLLMSALKVRIILHFKVQFFPIQNE